MQRVAVSVTSLCPFRVIGTERTPFELSRREYGYRPANDDLVLFVPAIRGRAHVDTRQREPRGSGR